MRRLTRYGPAHGAYQVAQAPLAEAISLYPLIHTNTVIRQFQHVSMSLRRGTHNEVALPSIGKSMLERIVEQLYARGDIRATISRFFR